MDLNGYVSDGDELETIYLNALEDQMIAEQALHDYRDLIDEFFHSQLDSTEDSDDTSKYGDIINRYLGDKPDKSIEEELRETGSKLGRYELILDSRAVQLETIYESMPENGFIWFDGDYHQTDEVRGILDDKIERVSDLRRKLHEQVEIADAVDKIPHQPDRERRVLNNNVKRPEDPLEDPDWPREYFESSV